MFGVAQRSGYVEPGTRGTGTANHRGQCTFGTPHGRPEAGERIKDRTDELLADLESIVIHDGGDEAILPAIERERRRLRG